MRLLQKEPYLQHYLISHLFSLPIENIVQVHAYERGEWIIQEGTPPDYLFYVLEGTAKIYMTHQNGKTSLLNFVAPFDFVGEMELLHETYYSKGIQTASELICLAIPLTYRAELLQDAIFLRQLCTLLSLKATNMAAKYSTSLAFPLENRLAQFILQTAHNGHYKEKHVTVCDYLGVSYRHLLHVLAQFCQDGLLKKDGRSYKICNEAALHAYASVLEHH